MGAHFYSSDAGDAESHHGPAWRSHLAALLPRQAIYLSFLGDAAAARLAQPADAARPALVALRAAGLQPSAHVRIDDGGPVLAC